MVFSLNVSVIIPSYNRATTIQRCLDSVLKQSLPANEIFVIDDGSTDNTSEIIKNNYKNINYLHQNNQGVSAARNLGIHEAKSEWLAFLDSDDEWLPNKLERQFQELEKSSHHELIHSDEIWVRNGVRVNPKHKHKKYGGDIFEHCLPLCCISPSAVMIHRDVFNIVGTFDENLPACEDYDLWLRICSKQEVLYIDEPLIIKYGGHADQLSQRYWGMDRFRITALEKLLNSDTLNMQQRSLTQAMLKEKLLIVLTGAKKRDNIELYNDYKNRYKQYL